MNLYFLVEGEKTELEVYPDWLKHLLPCLSRVDFACDATKENYYLISGMGMPSLLTEQLANSVKEINEFANYQYLILIIDADDMTAEERIAEIQQFMLDENIALNRNCHLHIVAQKYCMETWFLGNRKVFPRTTDNADFAPHAQFYNVMENDPELMQKPNSFARSISMYHEFYLRKMLAVRNIAYSKSTPREVGEKHYLEQLQKRVKETPHLSSLKNFFSFCETLSI